ncbi:hypothetical protein EG329_000409 [Mollisiaceae sp. DMI_Dod_QoI]|nr:hypothetical protein EG329_000409 [Helotiales sp. DMI_Dod_QoI]
MDVLRLVTEAPDITTFRDDKPTLLVSWWCTCYAIAIIAIRFCGRYVRAEKVFVEDGIMMLAITPLLIRMAFVHIVLLDGTNNTVITGLSSQDILQRQRGSQLVLVSRIFYAAYLWAIKYSTSMFLRTLTESVWQRSHQRYLRYLHIFLFLTFISTIVADLGACQPFSHYWQVVPDPGPSCRTGSAHLYTTGVLHIVTNLTLIIFPIPMIWKSKISGKQERKGSLVGGGGAGRGMGRGVSRWGSDEDLMMDREEVLESKAGGKGVVIGLRDLGAMREERGEGEEGGDGGDGDGEARGGLGNAGERGLLGSKRVRRPPEVKLGDIRVASTWEIRVDDK